MAKQEPTRTQIKKVAEITGYDISMVSADLISSIDIDTMISHGKDMGEYVSTLPGARRLTDLQETTFKQRKFIFYRTGYDVRQVETAYLDRERASWLIGKIKDGDNVNSYLRDIPGAYIANNEIRERQERYAEFEKLFSQASQAGQRAGDNAIPNPMIVTQPSDPLNDNSPPKNQWYVPEGVCGFAWIVVSDGRSSLARWMKKHHGARKHYYGGVKLSVFQFGQSYERKMAYARAFAKVFKDAGYDVYADGRLD